jgi:hypothetical protein
MTNNEILAAISAALKSITVTTLGETVLSPERFGAFIRAAQAKTTVIPKARFVEMSGQTVQIDRVSFPGRVLTRGISASTGGTEGTGYGTETVAEPTFAAGKLNAAEFRGKVALSDRAMRRSIERGALEDTLTTLFGEAAGRDLEEAGLLGDTSYNFGGESAALAHLRATSGWLKKAGHTVTGEVDTSADGWAEVVLQSLLDEAPKHYLVDRAEWAFFVPFALEDGYRDALRARGTPLGDSVQIGNAPVAYKGIPVVHVPMLERSTRYGMPCLLAPAANMVWGVFQSVTIEPKRVPENRETEFFLTVEADVGYEDSAAAVAGLLTVAPES